MTRAFDLALHRAKNMSRPRPSNLPKITIGIDFNQSSIPMAGGGGLSSIQKRMNIGGEPHRLSYINSDESSLLRQLGGSGQPVNGVPAYYMGDDGGGDPGIGSGWGDDATEDIGWGYSPPSDPAAADSEDIGWGYPSLPDPDPDTAPAVDEGEPTSTGDFMGWGKGWWSAPEIDDWFAGKGTPAEHARGALLGWGTKEQQERAMMNWKAKAKKEGRYQELSLFEKVMTTLMMPAVFAPAWQKKSQEDLDMINALKEALEDPDISLATRNDLEVALDERQQERAGISSREGQRQAFERSIGEPSTLPRQGLSSIPLKKAEEEEERPSSMASYLEGYRKEDVPPVGFKKSEIELFKRIYPDPNHPIWETINREREPMWPNIEEETVVV